VTAAPACQSCRGNPHHLEHGCPRCADSGVEPIEREPVSDATHVPEHCRECAADAIMRALIWAPIDLPRREHVASVASQGLARGLPVDHVIAYLHDEARVDYVHAQRCVQAYAAEVRGYARRVHPRHMDERGATDRLRVSQRCEAHAVSVEAGLPQWMRAA
jgi:hypothetical protein